MIINSKCKAQSAKKEIQNYKSQTISKIKNQNLKLFKSEKILFECCIIILHFEICASNYQRYTTEATLSFLSSLISLTP